jgi:glycosyltransferase involved in cell wall biosynthesis
MTNIQPPRVSIGLPVYNGENYIREAIDSILSQTFEDFELIISDNASTDETEKICREYANRDQRIKYYRNQQNLGAAKNYNIVFELSTGEYFKWVAHDDLCAPEFLEKCIKVLDSDSSIVLCYPRTKLIDEQGNVIEEFEFKRKADSSSISKRFKSLMWEDHCFQIFGLIRSSSLQKTRLIEPYAHGDGVLLCRLGFLGRFYEVPEYLFFNREHAEMSMQISYTRYDLYTAWFDPNQTGKIVLPRWRIFRGYYQALQETEFSWQQKCLCYLYLLRWFVGNRVFLVTELFRWMKKYFEDPFRMRSSNGNTSSDW